MFLGLRTAIYPVADLQAAKLWYIQVLEVTPYFDEPFYVGFNIYGFELGLIPDGVPGVDGAYAYRGVANAGQAYDRLIDLGAAASEPVNEVGHGIKVGSVIDPFGNRLSIIENPHFQLDARR